MADYTDTPLDLAPGLYKEATGYAARGRYVSGNNVRFWKGFPERIGGCAALVASGAMSATVTITVASPAVVTWNNHNFVAGQPVVFTTTGALPTGLTAGTTYYVISSGIGTNSFRVSATSGGSAVNTSGTQSGTHTGTATPAPPRGATAWRTLGLAQYAGYGSAYGLYLLQGANLYNITPSSFTLGSASGATTFGYGDSTYSISVWSGVETIYASTAAATTWTLANWGEDLIACPRGQGIYLWDASVGTGTRAATISGAPSVANGIFVSDVNRTLFAYGAHDGTAQDPLLLRWSSSEDYSTWSPSSTNTAGAIRAEVGNEIIGVVPARGGHVVCTDLATYFLKFIGGSYIYSLVRVSEGPSMISPHAGVQDAMGATYWMGPKSFYVYDGTVTPLPCDVHADVFENINNSQRHKIYCGTIRQYSEIIWLYPRTGSNEIDSAVVYNTMDRTWWQGSVILARTSWVDRSTVVDYPIGWDANGVAYAHEYGTSNNGTDYSYSLETGDFNAGDGAFLSGRKLVPNFDRITGTHSATIVVRSYPDEAEATLGPYSLTSTTPQMSIRSRGRQVRLRLQGSSDFRLGKFQVRTRPAGRQQ